MNVRIQENGAVDGKGWSAFYGAIVCVRLCVTVYVCVCVRVCLCVYTMLTIRLLVIWTIKFIALSSIKYSKFVY